MKKIIVILLVLLMSAFCAVSCNNDDEPDNNVDKIYHTVTFDYQNGQEVYVVQVEDKMPVAPPLDPEKEGYIFGGWKNKGFAWDFASTGIFGDQNFIAQWIDASSLFDYAVNDDTTVTITNYKGKLDEIRIPSKISGLTVSAVADGVFKDFEGIDVTVISIPDTVKHIGASTFEGRDGQNIVVVGELDSVGEKAFDGCAKLASVKLSDKLEKIPFRAFAECVTLEEVNIAEGVKVIGEDAFKNCASIKTIVIESKDFSVENSAFSGCDGLVTVFFMGNEAEWQNIIAKVDDGGNGNDALTDATVYYYSEAEAEGDFWYYNDKGEPRCW